MANPGSNRGRTLDAQTVLPVFAGVIVLIILMAVVDVYLVRTANAHRGDSARWSFDRAEEHRQRGEHAQALHFYRVAFEEDRRPAYQIALIRALRMDGQPGQARIMVERLLAEAPANGPANIEMARTLAAIGDWREAAWYYRRGLFGEWPTPVDLNRLRFELADLLATHNATQDLQAEIPLLDRDVTDPKDLRHLGRLLLAAERWNRAEEVYRKLLRDFREEPELWVALGKAQAGAGNYPAAAQSFRRALRYPESLDAAQQLALVQQVTGLDPSQRRLPRQERHRRAHELASVLIAAVERCAPKNSDVQMAKVELALHDESREYLQMAERDLDFVEQLWTAADELCGKKPEIPRAARLVITRIIAPGA